MAADSVLLRIPYETLRAELQKALPTPLYEVAKYNGDIDGKGADNGGVNWGCEVTLHSLNISKAGEATLSVTADVRYWVDGRTRAKVAFFSTPLIYGSAGVNEPLRELALDFKVHFRSVNNVEIEYVGARPGNRVKITIFDIDITDLIVSRVHPILQHHTKHLQEIVNDRIRKSPMLNLAEALQLGVRAQDDCLAIGSFC